MSSATDKVIIQCLNGEEFIVNKFKLQTNSLFMNSMIDEDPTLPYPTLNLLLPVTRVTQLVQFIENNNHKPWTSIKDCYQFYILSKMYRIQQLEDNCREYLVQKMKPENICSIHDFACKQNDTFIQYHCWKVFDASWQEIFSSDDFLRCKETTIRRFLSRPIYTNLPEIELFLAVYKWVEMQFSREKKRYADQEKCCRFRWRMEPFLSMIRLLIMSRVELIECVFKLDLLTKEEMDKILICKSTEKTDHLHDTNLCKSFDLRNKGKYETLRKYRKRKNLGFLQSRYVSNNNRRFTCEIFVEEDCFIDNLLLPIKLHNFDYIMVRLYGFVNDRTIGINYENLKYSKIDKLRLKKPIFLAKGSVSQLTIEILKECTSMDNIIEIDQNSDCFVSGPLFNSKNEKEIRTRLLYRNYFYVDPYY